MTPDSLMHSNPQSELMTASQVASLFAVRRKTVYTWSYRGLLTPVQIKGTGTVRFLRSEVYAMLEPQNTSAPENTEDEIIPLETVDKWPEPFRIGIKKMQLYRRNRVWQLSFSLHGKQYRSSLKTSDYESALLKISSEVAKLLSLENIEVYSPQGTHTLKELLNRHVSFKSSRVEPGTIRRYQVSAKQLVKFFSKDKDIASLSLEDVEDYQSQRKASAGTINRDLTLLLAALKKATQWNWLSLASIQNMLQNYQKLREPEPRDRVYTEEEIERLLMECSKQIRPIVIADLVTGMRMSELIHLKWVDVDLDRKQIKVMKTKTHRNRTIPIRGELLMNTLQKLYIERTSEYVFTRKDGKPYKQGFDKGFRAAKKRAGITDANFHDLRRTYSTVLMELGESERVIQKLLGHSRLETTARYLAVRDARLQDAQERIDTHFSTLLKR
jgi:integrase/predicted DNA-binding transcriptional regulator AlpA